MNDSCLASANPFQTALRPENPPKRDFRHQLGSKLCPYPTVIRSITDLRLENTNLCYFEGVSAENERFMFGKCKSLPNCLQVRKSLKRDFRHQLGSKLCPYPTVIRSMQIYVGQEQITVGKNRLQWVRTDLQWVRTDLQWVSIALRWSRTDLF
jgi:hypothetical protein